VVNGLQTVFISGIQFTADYTNSTRVVLTRQKTDVSVAVTSSSKNNTSIFGEPVTFKAVVTSASGAAATFPTSDTVTFTLDGNAATAQTVNVDATGTASIDSKLLVPSIVPMAVTLAGKPHTLSVKFNGDSSFNTGTGTLANGQTVNQASSSTDVQSSVASPVIGQAMDFTATVSPVSPSSEATPTGSVTFFVDGTKQTGTFNLDATGNVKLTNVSFATSGPHTVRADYGATTNFAASTKTLTITVSLASSSVSVAAAKGSSVFGEPVVYTATVSSASPTTKTPSAGSLIQFIVDGVNKGPTVALVQNGTQMQAQITFNDLDVAHSPHTIDAKYLGDANFASSQSTTSSDATETITQGSTTTKLTSSPVAWQINTPITFTATVSPVAPSTLTPSGKVIFNVDGVDQQTAATAISLDANGKANFTFTITTGGMHAVKATFQGTTDYGSSSDTLTQGVVQFTTSTTVALTTGTNPSQVKDPLTFTATITPSGGSTPTKGTVTFTIDGVNQTPVNLSSPGKATFTISTFSATTPGHPHTIAATYNGSGSDLIDGVSGLSNTLMQTVNKATTSTSSPVVKVGGKVKTTVLTTDTVTITVTITKGANVGAFTTGTVTYFADGTSPLGTVGIGTGLVDNGATLTATLNLPATPHNGLSVTTHTLSATYNGDDPLYSGSKSTSASLLTVQSGDPASRLVFAPAPPSMVQVNTAFALTLNALDATNNLAVTASGPVTVSLVSPSGTVSSPGSTLSGTGGVSISGGVATLSNLKFTTTGTFKVRLSFGTLTLDFTITVTPAPKTPPGGRVR
jgi:hypothetical protein